MPIIYSITINSVNDDDHYEALVKRQIRNYKNYDTTRNYYLFSIGSTVAVQQEDGGLWTMEQLLALVITTITIDPTQSESQSQAIY